MELEGDRRQDQAQKIIEMPQRDRETSTLENQPSSASVVSMYGQEKPSIPSLHQQLAEGSGTQTIQLREELVLAVAQNASAQATGFEAEVKDQLEVAKETVSHKVAEVSQMAHSMAQFFNRRRSGATIRRVLHGYLLGPSGRGGEPRPSKGLFHTSVRFGRATGGCISPIGGLGQGTSSGL